MESTRSFGSKLTYNKRPGISVWAPVAIGAAIGLFGAILAGRRKTASRKAVGGLVAGVVGLSAWASGRLLAPAAYAAARRVNAVRDARWLAAHPITYA